MSQRFKCNCWTNLQLTCLTLIGKPAPAEPLSRWRGQHAALGVSRLISSIIQTVSASLTHLSSADAVCNSRTLATEPTNTSSSQLLLHLNTPEAPFCTRQKLSPTQSRSVYCRPHSHCIYLRYVELTCAGACVCAWPWALSSISLKVKLLN